MAINHTKEYVVTVASASKLAKSWRNAAIIWRTLDHIFVIGSFFSSILVVYITASFPGDQAFTITLSSVAAVLTLMSFACNPAKYMMNYRLAFQTLKSALQENVDGGGNFIGGEKGRNQVVIAIKQGESYIGRTYELKSNCSDTIKIAVHTYRHR